MIELESNSAWFLSLIFYQVKTSSFTRCPIRLSCVLNPALFCLKLGPVRTLPLQCPRERNFVIAGFLLVMLQKLNVQDPSMWWKLKAQALLFWTFICSSDQKSNIRVEHKYGTRTHIMSFHSLNNTEKNTEKFLRGPS